MIFGVVISNRRGPSDIGDCLRTLAPHVDRILICGTHHEPYDFRYERSIVPGVETCQLAPITQERHMAERRTEAIQRAADIGADWVVMLDTDERLHIPIGIDVRTYLRDAVASDTLILRAAEGNYWKDKVFRPGTGAFAGVTHEAWVPANPSRRHHWVGPRFSELPKTPEQLLRRDLRVIAALRREYRHSPSPRSAFYLGITYLAHGHAKRAEPWLRLAVETTQWAEEAAWANYCLAQIRYNEGSLDHCVLHAVYALACCPVLAEAAWIAGVARAGQGRAQDALAWSQIAVALGCFEGRGNTYSRQHFRDPQALWEAPYETLRATYKALGRHDDERAALETWRRAYRQRLKEDGGVVLPETDWRLT